MGGGRLRFWGHASVRFMIISIGLAWCGSLVAVAIGSRLVLLSRLLFLLLLLLLLLLVELLTWRLSNDRTVRSRVERCLDHQ